RRRLAAGRGGAGPGAWSLVGGAIVQRLRLHAPAQLREMTRRPSSICLNGIEDLGGGNVRLLLLLWRPQSSVSALLSSVAPLFTSFSSFSSPLTSHYQLISSSPLRGLCFYGCPFHLGLYPRPFSIFDICVSLSFMTFFLILSPHPTPFLFTI
ncbi:hypothetical protein JEQ12_012088, partial [Ovis aries]